MSVIQVCGLHSLDGEIRIQGSKNAVLPVMAASLLHSGTIVINNVPGIQDVFCMMGILTSLGCTCCLEGGRLTIDTAGLCSAGIPETESRQMRSSVMLLGPLLGRLHEASGYHPGGCVIGKRPIDLHLYALRRLGAEIEIRGEQIRASAAALQGADICLTFPSVGATENALMAAVAAEGVTCIRGAAREPEIEILCRFLQTMGARIEGIGEGLLVVHGGGKLHDAEFTMPGDRIVAGTYLGAVLAAGGSVYLRGAPWQQMESVLETAGKAGGCVRTDASGLRICMNRRPCPVELVTGPYPSFPTDLQSVMLAVASLADGSSRITETIFEERFATAKELQKLGAHIIIEDRTACVAGRKCLKGGCVRASDLRGGAALVVAGLAAEGVTEIAGYGYIRRGYEDICRDLQNAGARICLLEDGSQKPVRS